MSEFELHPRLARDCLVLGRFSLCRVLLMNESRYPWLILVPQRAGMTEIHQLHEADQIRLIRESSLLGQQIQRTLLPDKLNIAAIGNLVPQLHLHHIARYQADSAWPAPVWGRFDPAPYTPDAMSLLCRRLALGELPGFLPES